MLVTATSPLHFGSIHAFGKTAAIGMANKAPMTVLMNSPDMSMKDPTIIYSAVGTVQDMRELVDLVAAGRVKSHVSRVGALSELDTIFDELQAGQYLGRAVINDLTR